MPLLGVRVSVLAGSVSFGGSRPRLPSATVAAGVRAGEEEAAAVGVPSASSAHLEATAALACGKTGAEREDPRGAPGPRGRRRFAGVAAGGPALGGTRGGLAGNPVCDCFLPVLAGGEVGRYGKRTSSFCGEWCTSTTRGRGCPGITSLATPPVGALVPP
mmetsp:Transcript_146359/g.469548  ORF Transcript_146359/g.469548 Transcript_146359/m.469548 type:complete len:160 (-) Transcript_146359:144-623(-)